MRILLVEDEEKVSRFVTLGLNAEQFVVVCARMSSGARTDETGSDALALD